MGKSEERRKIFWFSLIGLLLILIGLIIGILLPAVADQKLKDIATVCNKNDDDYDLWKTTNDPDSPEYYQTIYMFDLINPSDVLVNGTTSKLYENGPYVYRQYRERFNIRFSDNEEYVQYSEWEYFVLDEDKSCDTCTSDAMITHLNPAYLSLLRQVANEGILFLMTECTTTQIGLIGLGLASPCTESQRGDATAFCECCNVTTCSDIATTDASATQLFSLMAKYDNGYKLSDQVGYILVDGIYSEAIVDRSVSEWLFGGPNALGGYLTVSESTDENEILQYASYTNDIGTVCISNCGGSSFADFSCDGNAPNATSLTSDYEYLANINCMPYTWTYTTAAFCALQSVSDIPCECAIAGQSPPCCLTNGSLLAYGIDSLNGFGCLAEVPGGIVSRNYQNAEDNAKNYFGQVTSVQYTGCNKKNDISEYVQYDNITALPAWYTPSTYTYPDMTELSTDVNDVLNGDKKATYIHQINGHHVESFPPRGLSGNYFSREISNGKPQNESYAVFAKTNKRISRFYHTGKEKVKGINTARFSPLDTLLDGSEELQQTGVGVPFDGIVSVSYLLGFPGYFGSPYFLNGDIELIYQNDSTSLFKFDLDGGIEMYHTSEWNDPTNDKIIKVAPDSPVLVTASFLKTWKDELSTWINIEPATGKAIYGHRRGQFSFGTWECDPTAIGACAIFPNKGTCYVNYACSATNVLTPNMVGGKILPALWVDEAAILTDDDADKIKSVSDGVFAARLILVIFLITGGLILGIAFLLYCYSSKRSKVGVTYKVDNLALA